MVDYADDELEMLAERARRKFLAQQQQERNPASDLGLQLAAGGIDVLSKGAQNEQDIMSIATGIKGPNMQNPSAADSMRTALASRATAARQAALDDTNNLTSIQKLIDAKREREQAGKKLERENLNRRQDFFAKGIEILEDGSQRIIPGGDADLSRQEKLAKIAESKSKTGSGVPGGAGRETYVPGVGEALTKDDAKTLKDATVMKSKLDRQLQEMIDLRKKYGAEVMDRAAVARGQQLSKDILLTYKNLQKLGVLSRSDEDIINAIIPSDPLQSTMSSVTGIGEDPILSNLQKFKADNQQDYDANLNARLRPGQASKTQPDPEDLEAIQWLQANPNDPDAEGVRARLRAKRVI